MTTEVANPTSGSTANAVPAIPAKPLPADIAENVLPDHEDNDSTYGSSLHSETTFVTSSVYRGYLENGRKYQTLRDDGYITPADEQQFECLQGFHIYQRILDCREENPLFRSPIMRVKGIDLYPPPQTYVPSNCSFLVDDVTHPWFENEKFDLIYLRFMLGSFTYPDWDTMYKHACEYCSSPSTSPIVLVLTDSSKLNPGGWIEHLEIFPGFFCDDNTMPSDSACAGYRDILLATSEAYGKRVDIVSSMRERIEGAGFINVREKNFKALLGAWPKHPIYKDAGRVGLDAYKAGMEGFILFFFTQYGQPTPWTVEEVKAYLAKTRQELDSNWHIHHKYKRVWAQKPFEIKSTEAKKGIDNLGYSHEGGQAE